MPLLPVEHTTLVGQLLPGHMRIRELNRIQPPRLCLRAPCNCSDAFPRSQSESAESNARILFGENIRRATATSRINGVGTGKFSPGSQINGGAAAEKYVIISKHNLPFLLNSDHFCQYIGVI